MQNKLVIFKTFNNPIDANITKGLLESNGIESFIKDENTVYANPVFTTAIGGVKLLINESDLEKAVAICGGEEKQEEFSQAQLTCPKCKSSDVILKNKPNWFAFIIMFLSFASTPSSGNVKKYVCKGCGFSWKDSDN